MSNERLLENGTDMPGTLQMGRDSDAESHAGVNEQEEGPVMMEVDEPPQAWALQAAVAMPMVSCAPPEVREDLERETGVDIMGWILAHLRQLKVFGFEMACAVKGTQDRVRELWESSMQQWARQRNFDAQVHAKIVDMDARWQGSLYQINQSEQNMRDDMENMIGELVRMWSVWKGRP